MYYYGQELTDKIYVTKIRDSKDVNFVTLKIYDSMEDSNINIG
jgi:hypothetical protein